MARPLRVAIDLRPVALESGGGVGLLVGQIVEELQHQDVAFVGIADRPVPPGRLPPGVPVWSVAGPGGRIRWESFALPGWLRGLDPAPDLFHATWNHGVPRGLPFPSLLSLHDLIPWFHPGFVPWPKPAWLHSMLYRRTVRASAKEAAWIVTLSEASRADIERVLPEARGRLEVIPCAVPRWFRPASDEAVAAVRARFGGPYWLYLGGFDPRKGVETLVEALRRIDASAADATEPGDASGSEAPPLPPVVLAGGIPRGEARAWQERVAGLKRRIHFPGFVPDADLPALFQGASLFIYPSRAEGFGIPPLLAMAAGVPVVGSSGTAVEEVIGSAGRLVPPGDASALARALTEAAEGSGDAARRAEARARASAFTVEALASRMRAAYERAASRPQGSR